MAALSSNAGADFPPFAAGGRFAVCVEGVFHSAHFLRAYFPDGSDEPVHGHTWKVEILLGRLDGGLTDSGIALDFVPLHERLNMLLRRIGHCCVNDLPEFASVNPTAENIARWFYAGLKESVRQSEGRMIEVRVHEGPGNVAIFYPDPG
ncbi:MAG: 6-carboxytetrahydropterin synthase [Spirochaetales bacterium]|nr:6-carboxytetrahydropterin synthase [Spirochaetales bacterium]